VVSLAPSMTEALFAIGAGSSVVGVSRYCDYPEAATHLPRVGGFLDPSLEAILALSPDLVVGARSPSNRGVVETIEAHHIAVYFPHDESLQGVRDMLRELGERTDHAAQANALVASMNNHLLAIDSALAARTKPRVLLVFNQNPMSVAGPGTFPDEMLRHAGGINAVSDGNGYPTLSIERVMALAPDVIVEAWMGAGERTASDWGRYTTIPAVAHGRVIAVEDERLLRPGPRLVEGVGVLARLLHPDATIP
jgi:iron complex transport system substrate-binding protein